MSSPSFETPWTRGLVNVLREGFRTPAPDASLLVAELGAASADAHYVNVLIGGVEVRVPRIRGAVVGSPGEPAYVLVTRSLMLYLGTV